jgi:hypothetical protein
MTFERSFVHKGKEVVCYSITREAHEQARLA